MNRSPSLRNLICRGLLAALFMPLSAFATSNADSADLLVHEPELKVQYGVYSEATISLDRAENRKVEWSILESSIPPGFAVYDTRSSDLLLYGTPQFTGTWCTVYVANAPAANGRNAIIGQDQVCFNSEENPSLRHPTFVKKDRYLDIQAPGKSFSQILAASDPSGSSLSGEVMEDSLPDLNRSQSGKTGYISFSGNRFILQGSIASEGVFSFALKIRNRNGVENYQQYELIVESPEVAPACPAGYYFDSNLGYCVPYTQEVACPAGTYYEASANQCIQYPAPPPTVVCRAGYYFDPFHSRCVPAYAERCPLNYSYDAYEGRCVRRPYTCGFNERYDYFRMDCVRVYRQSCFAGEHFDYYLNRCVRNYTSCYAGFYYNLAFASCQPVAYRCGYNEVFDPRFGGCRSIYAGTTCSYGSLYDWRLNRCVVTYSRLPNYCPAGQYYDSYRGGCVFYSPRNNLPRTTVVVSRPAYCSRGSTFDPRLNRCVAVSTPVQTPRTSVPRQPSARATCPGGQTYENGRCTSPSQSRGRTTTPTTDPRQTTPRQSTPGSNRNPVPTTPSTGRTSSETGRTSSRTTPSQPERPTTRTPSTGSTGSSSRSTPAPAPSSSPSRTSSPTRTTTPSQPSTPSRTTTPTRSAPSTPAPAPSQPRSTPGTVDRGNSGSSSRTTTPTSPSRSSSGTVSTPGSSRSTPSTPAPAPSRSSSGSVGSPSTGRTSAPAPAPSRSSSGSVGSPSTGRTSNPVPAPSRSSSGSVGSPSTSRTSAPAPAPSRSSSGSSSRSSSGSSRPPR